MLGRLMDHIPIWGFFLLMALVALASIEIGHRIGARRRRISKHEREGPVGVVVGAAIGLLGFMVALTLGAAEGRLDSRKEAMIEGVNAIESAHRIAGLVPEPHASETRRLLGDYVRLRIAMPQA